MTVRELRDLLAAYADDVEVMCYYEDQYLDFGIEGVELDGEMVVIQLGE